MITQISYIFNCPVHGVETSAFCWRAFSEENVELWKKYEITYKKVEFAHGEKQRLLRNFRASATGDVCLALDAA